MADTPPSRPQSAGHLRLRITSRIGAIVAISLVLMTGASAGLSRVLLDSELRVRARLAADALAMASPHSDAETLQATAAVALEHLPDGAYVALRGAGGEVLALAVSRELRFDRSDLGEARAGSVRREVGGEAVEECTVHALGPTGSARLFQVGLRRGPMEARVARNVLFLAALALILMLISLLLGGLASHSVATPLEALARAAHEVARGRLEAPPAAEPQGALGSLSNAFRTMVESLRATHRDLHEASAQIASVVEELHVAAVGQAQVASQQWDSMSCTGEALDEMTATRRLAVEHAAALIRRAEETEQLSSEGMRVIGEALSALQDLSQDVREIARSIARQSDLTVQVGSIAAAVKDLAEQSNLLALNAAVEAARAGERGLGFAVVAQEMRGLAAQSKEASARIRSMLVDANRAMRESLTLAEASERRAESAGTLALGAGDFIGRIAEAVRESYLGAKEIESSTEQQTRHVDEIAQAMTGLSSTAQRARDGSGQLSSMASQLGELSRRLASLLQRFSLELPEARARLESPNGAEAAPPAAPDSTAGEGPTEVSGSRTDTRSA